MQKNEKESNLIKTILKIYGKVGMKRIDTIRLHELYLWKAQEAYIWSRA